MQLGRGVVLKGGSHQSMFCPQSEVSPNLVAPLAPLALGAVRSVP